jgi:histidyl-tRNA synthetase
MIIKPLPISGYYENMPEEQIIEDRFKEIIKKNYSLSGFTPLDTPVVERVDCLTAKWADDNEIYGIYRLNGDESSEAKLWLRFDLTVPFARYVAQNEWTLSFPFKRQHIARVYRWERPQKGRYREFYQADVDIVWNWKLSLFADVEVLSTIYNSLLELDFGAFEINMNNKKFLSGFLISLEITDIAWTISVIDKKDKVRRDKFAIMLEEIWVNEEQKNSIINFINISSEKSSEELFEYFSSNTNELLQEGLEELKYVYNNLLALWVQPDYLVFNPTISRGLNYYTGTVYETFIKGAENMWSISSGGRYENLASNFTKNSFPGVGWSIGLSRVIAVLRELKKIEFISKTVTEVLVLNMGDSTLKNNLELVKNLRNSNINTEIYLDESKVQKQLKYAYNKWIRFVIIAGESEHETNMLQLKDIITEKQIEINKEDIIKEIISLKK